ncbi:MAG: hypothetical protein L0Z50_37640 [Verrucomicrobiales bacterium]|nr:hypothetical protein [Verrucomicrobiales bacterium]
MSIALLLLSFKSTAQTLVVTDFKITPDGRIVLQHTADTNSYYILRRGKEITAILTAKVFAPNS